MSALIFTAALKGTAVLVVAWIATLLLRRGPADLRHKIWLAALIAMAFLLIPVSMPQSMRMTIDAGAPPAGAVSAAARSMEVLPVVWSVLCALLLLRWGAGLVRLFRITRAARFERGVQVSAAIQTPLTWGALRPVILVPEYLMEWSADQREIVMRHENAHIQRQDWLWQSFAGIMTAVFWFHPLVWLAAARLRQEAEHAADDATLAAGIAAPDYADRLMAVARQVKGSGSSAVWAAVTMTRHPLLAERISSILDARRTRQGASLLSRAGVVLGVAALLVPLAAFQNRPVYHIGEAGVSAPKVMKRVEPQYTPDAKEAKVQGVVKLAAVINAQGKAEDIRVTESLDPGLDANAVIAISQWLFSPGAKDGQPVDVGVVIEVHFKLL